MTTSVSFPFRALHVPRALYKLTGAVELVLNEEGGYVIVSDSTGIVTAVDQHDWIDLTAGPANPYAPPPERHITPTTGEHDGDTMLISGDLELRLIPNSNWVMFIQRGEVKDIFTDCTEFIFAGGEERR